VTGGVDAAIELRGINPFELMGSSLHYSYTPPIALGEYCQESLDLSMGLEAS